MQSDTGTEKNSRLSQQINVVVEKPDSTKQEFSFSGHFSIGRSEGCSIRLDDGEVSRIHIEILRDKGSWWVVDKQSSNGTYLNGQRIDMVELKDMLNLQLGRKGPLIKLTLTEKTPERVSTILDSDASVTKYVKHYFEQADEGAMGDHTRMMREAFKVVKKKQTSKYIKIIAGAGVLVIALVAYLIIQEIKQNKQMKLAENIFYDMKSLELEISAFRDKIEVSNDPELSESIRKFDARHSQLEKNYDALMEEIGTYNLDEDEKLIVKMARKFGECELNMPKEFIDEVKTYINRWRSTSKLVDGLNRAKNNNYTPVIVNYFVRQNLPPQFFYLALRESDFRENAIGPNTRYGHAKGMWQFIAETGKRYGLSVGNAAKDSVFDSGDDRFNFLKATIAASKYIKDIYNTDAQASGLLVMGSYNWGEYNVIHLIKKMAENPRDRNFWNLLKNFKDKIPVETYNYVFYIFSAAVIGENPSLFGFDFENPLKEALTAINYQ